jgi:hypothetical protein
MWEWVRDHVEWVLATVLAVVGGAVRFALHRDREFRDLQSGHATLRDTVAEHLEKAEPLMAEHVVLKADVRRLEENIGERFDSMEAAMHRGLDELRTDFRTLNTLLVSVLKRGFGGIRDEDDASTSRVENGEP